MASTFILRLVCIVLLHDVCAAWNYIYKENLASTVYDYAKAISLTFSVSSLNISDDPCAAADYFFPNYSNYKYGKDLQEQINYQAALQPFMLSKGFVPYSPRYELPQQNHYEKFLPKYFRLAPRVPFPPILQKKFLIRRPQSFNQYLVNANDFNKDFHDVIYVSDYITLESTDYMDYEVQICSPCNRHFNRTYWSYSDFNERYVSCSLSVKYPGTAVALKPLYHGLCKNDEAYQKICNPCKRKQKIVKVPITNRENPRIKLRLPYDEIVQLGVPFWDKYNNVYEFMSFSEYNIQFDNEHGNPLPSGYDHSEMYKYYYSQDRSKKKYK